MDSASAASRSVATASEAHVGFEPPRGVSRIEAEHGCAYIMIPTEGRPRGLWEVFRPLSRAGVSVDTIKLHDTSLQFSLSEDQVETASRVLDELDLTHEVTPDCAVLTIYAPDMRSIPGVMATIVAGLHEVGVAILATDDSYNSVFCIIPSAQADAACRALAERFGLESVCENESAESS